MNFEHGLPEEVTKFKAPDRKPGPEVRVSIPGGEISADELEQAVASATQEAYIQGKTETYTDKVTRNSPLRKTGS